MRKAEEKKREKEVIITQPVRLLGCVQSPARDALCIRNVGCTFMFRQLLVRVFGRSVPN